MREPSTVWWNDITGPRTLVDGVIGALLDRKNVLLSVPADLPWREEMRGSVEREFRQRTGLYDLAVEMIDVRDQCPGEKDVGGWLLRRFADRTVAGSFRERPGVTVVKYLAQHKVLANRLIWVKGVDAGDAKAWLRFCRDYAPTGVENGMVVLECDREGETPSRCFAEVSYDRQVTAYDMEIFNSTLLGSGDFRQYSDLWKRYIAALCAALCGTDAQVASRLLTATDFLRESPLEGLRRLAAHPDFARRGEGAGHVLHKLRSGGEELLERDIWSAQLQVAFPCIEFRRVRFIQAHLAGLSALLQKEEVWQGANQARVRVYDPMDLEVGSLRYLSRLGTEEAAKVFGPGDEAEFTLLRDLRNKLAHLICCTPQELAQLFD